MWLPYSKYHGFSMFHKVPSDHLFAHFGAPFGTPSGPLGTQMALRRRKRAFPKNTKKPTSLKVAKSYQKTLQTGRSQIAKLVFFGVWSRMASRESPRVPF